MDLTGIFFLVQLLRYVLIAGVFLCGILCMAEKKSVLQKNTAALS